MKIRKLILLGALMILVSCGSDFENFGRSDCAVSFTNLLETAEDRYENSMREPDSNGNQSSLEVCLQRKLLTELYLFNLRSEKNNLNLREGCTSEEISEFNTRLSNRIQDLEEDMESTWNHCEDIYGGG